ncbi:hypothetical protein SEMRO_645_G180620.1 [Seminavis robusta]|uniref:Uncharacterized protein n=1 Tax=Seminavis robusta TaxID=568900 RepID=A0A9N8E7X4_9STRA|nr:hypothetical protein SEMRO_645_G180620.1 [Seminavis robusta]|eukprot:Sro645_g180620.1 n/a (169) ;mRNA; r:22784-23290
MVASLSLVDIVGVPEGDPRLKTIRNQDLQDTSSPLFELLEDSQPQFATPVTHAPTTPATSETPFTVVSSKQKRVHHRGRKRTPCASVTKSVCQMMSADCYQIESSSSGSNWSSGSSADNTPTGDQSKKKHFGLAGSNTVLSICSPSLSKGRRNTRRGTWTDRPGCTFR